MPLRPHVIPCTAQAKLIVRQVLSPHPVTGLHHQRILSEVISQFGEEKAQVKFPLRSHVPDVARLPMEHPLRSMRYLKKVVLPTMEEATEVERIRILRGKRGDEPHGMDTINSKIFGQVEIPPLITEKVEWRWRIIPDEEKNAAEEKLKSAILFKQQEAERKEKRKRAARESKRKRKLDKEEVQR